MSRFSLPARGGTRTAPKPQDKPSTKVGHLDDETLKRVAAGVMTKPKPAKTPDRPISEEDLEEVDEGEEEPLDEEEEEYTEEDEDGPLDEGEEEPEPEPEPEPVKPAAAKTRDWRGRSKAPTTGKEEQDDEPEEKPSAKQSREARQTVRGGTDRGSDSRRSPRAVESREETPGAAKTAGSQEPEADERLTEITEAVEQLCQIVAELSKDLADAKKAITKLQEAKPAQAQPVSVNPFPAMLRKFADLMES